MTARGFSANSVAWVSTATAGKTEWLFWACQIIEFFRFFLGGGYPFKQFGKVRIWMDLNGANGIPGFVFESLFLVVFGWITTHWDLFLCFSYVFVQVLCISRTHRWSFFERSALKKRSRVPWRSVWIQVRRPARWRTAKQRLREVDGPQCWSLVDFIWGEKHKKKKKKKQQVWNKHTLSHGFFDSNFEIFLELNQKLSDLFGVWFILATSNFDPFSLEWNSSRSGITMISPKNVQQPGDGLGYGHRHVVGKRSIVQAMCRSRDLQSPSNLGWSISGVAMGKVWKVEFANSEFTKDYSDQIVHPVFTEFPSW